MLPDRAPDSIAAWDALARDLAARPDDPLAGYPVDAAIRVCGYCPWPERATSIVPVGRAKKRVRCARCGSEGRVAGARTFPWRMGPGVAWRNDRPDPIEIRRRSGVVEYRPGRTVDGRRYVPVPVLSPGQEVRYQPVAFPRSRGPSRPYRI